MNRESAQENYKRIDNYSHIFVGNWMWIRYSSNILTKQKRDIKNVRKTEKGRKTEKERKKGKRKKGIKREENTQNIKHNI